jgi:hypothetical protein
MCEGCEGMTRWRDWLTRNACHLVTLPLESRTYKEHRSTRTGTCQRDSITAVTSKTLDTSLIQDFASAAIPLCLTDFACTFEIWIYSDILSGQGNDLAARPIMAGIYDSSQTNTALPVGHGSFKIWRDVIQTRLAKQDGDKIQREIIRSDSHRGLLRQ